jgi:WS/DGAT/MGAT family acyltransferase
LRTDPISPLDLAFLLLEREAAPMHIGAVAVFQPRSDIDAERVADLLGQRTEGIPLLRRRARFSLWAPRQAHWVEHKTFHAANHIHAHHLPSPGGPDEFAELVSRVGAEPLDLTRPLWELHLITGLDEGRFAVLMKLHHALTDGTAAVKLGLGFLDPSRLTPRTHPKTTSGSSSGFDPLGLLSRPGRAFESILTSTQKTLNAARTTVEITSSVLGNARLAPRHPLAITGSSPSRRMALLRLPISEIRRARAAHGGTTHEVVLATITGALRHWLTSRGEAIDELDLTALIPASRRARGTDTHAHNQLSGYLCTLPVGEAKPLRRLHTIQAAMRGHKAAGLLRGAGAFPVLADRIHPMFHRLVTPTAGNFASMLFDAMITHVPLPTIPLSLAGADLRELYPLAPVPSGHTLSIGTAHYADTLHIGLNCDRTAVPDLEKLTEALPPALTEIHTAHHSP